MEKILAILKKIIVLIELPPSHLPTRDNCDQKALIPQLSTQPSLYHSCDGGCSLLLLPFLPTPLGSAKGIQSPLSTPEGYPTPPSTSTSIPSSLHPAPPSPYLQRPLTNPRAPSESLARGLPPWGAAGEHTHLTKPCFVPPTNPPNCPQVELDTCCLSSRTQE